MSISLFSSPLQGFTDFRFRNAYNKFFTGIDTFIAPYIRLNGKIEIKSRYQKDILPKNNPDVHLVPQIMCNNAEEFILLSNYAKKLGYNELNWNLGCPYPMVAKRGLGSGLIKDPAIIDQVMQRVYAETDISVSVKIRLGYENKEEILHVLPVLGKYPIKYIAIHPRIGKQLYKGDVDLPGFQKCLENTDHKVVYNGNINSVAKFRELQDHLPTINNWMIGRWIIADPFLPEMIKNNTSEYPENRIEIFSKFHDTLLDEYSEALSGDGHIVMRMYQFWKYFILSFPESQKGFKKIKKARSLDDYNRAVNELFKSSTR